MPTYCSACQQLMLFVGASHFAVGPHSGILVRGPLRIQHFFLEEARASGSKGMIEIAVPLARTYVALRMAAVTLARSNRPSMSSPFSRHD